MLTVSDLSSVGKSVARRRKGFGLNDSSTSMRNHGLSSSSDERGSGVLALTTDFPFGDASFLREGVSLWFSLSFWSSSFSRLIGLGSVTASLLVPGECDFFST